MVHYLTGLCIVSTYSSFAIKRKDTIWYPFFLFVMGLEKFNGTVQWTVPTTSSKTGGNCNVTSPIIHPRSEIHAGHGKNLELVNTIAVACLKQLLDLACANPEQDPDDLNDQLIQMSCCFFVEKKPCRRNCAVCLGADAPGRHAVVK